jgi:hypothetical protein
MRDSGADSCLVSDLRALARFVAIGAPRPEQDRQHGDDKDRGTCHVVQADVGISTHG